MMKTQNKNFGLEGLRGLASLSVAIGHFVFVFFPFLATLFYPAPGATAEFGFERWAQIPPISLLYSAEAAVCVFFVMSGYVLTTKYFATNDVSVIQTAASKRYIRLALPCFASVMLAWVLASSGAIVTHDAVSIGVAGWVPSWYVGPFSFLGSVFNGLIGAPLFGHTELNPPLWTIQVELIGSILLFAMFAAFGRHPLWLCVWFLFFADVLGYFLPNALFYIAFFVGALLNLATDWLRSRQVLSALLAILGLIGCAYNLHPAFALFRTVHLPDLKPYGPDFNVNVRLFWNTLGAIALVAGVIGSRHFAAAFSKKTPVFLGKISFSVYVIHMPLLMSVGLRTARMAQSFGFTRGLSALIAFIVYISVVLIAATAFYRCVDLQSMKLADAIGKKTGRRSRVETRPHGQPNHADV